jgi:hypothetical protein
MFELLLTRLQARRLANAVLALDAKESSSEDTRQQAHPATPLQPTPSSEQVKAIRDRVRRLQDVLDLSVAARPGQQFAGNLSAVKLVHDSHVKVLDEARGWRVADCNEAASNADARAGDVHTCASDSAPDSGGVGAWDVQRTEEEEGGSARRTEGGNQDQAVHAGSGSVHEPRFVNLSGIQDRNAGAHDRQGQQVVDGTSGSVHESRLVNLSPVSSANSEQSIEGELDLLWRGAGSVLGDADLLSARGNVMSQDRDGGHAGVGREVGGWGLEKGEGERERGRERDVERRLERAATRSERCTMRAVRSGRDGLADAASMRHELKARTGLADAASMRHELNAMEEDFVRRILQRRASAGVGGGGGEGGGQGEQGGLGGGEGDWWRRGGLLRGGRDAKEWREGQGGTRAGWVVLEEDRKHTVMGAEGEGGGVGAKGVGQTVWVIGGWNGCQLLSTVEYLDPRTSQWTKAPSLRTPRRSVCGLISYTSFTRFWSLFISQSHVLCSVARRHVTDLESKCIHLSFTCNTRMHLSRAPRRNA